MPDIPNEKVIHLLAHTYAYAKSNHFLLLRLLSLMGEGNMKEIFESQQEQIASNLHQVLKMYGIDGYDGPEMSKMTIDDLL